MKASDVFINRDLPSEVEPTPDSAILPDALFDQLSEQFRIILGRPEAVRDVCRQLTDTRSHPLHGIERQHWLTASRWLTHRNGLVAAPLFEAVEEIALEDPDPWPFVKSLLASPDEELHHRALKSLILLVKRHQLRVSREVLLEFAGLPSNRPLTNPDQAEAAFLLVEQYHNSDTSGKDPALTLFLNESDPSLRELAASLLDRRVGTPASETMSIVLGYETFSILAPYLEYTRATHEDLLSLIPSHQRSPSFPACFRTAESMIGSRRLKTIVASLGWKSVNLLLETQELHQIRINDRLPLFLSPAEVNLFRNVTALSDDETYCLVTTYGAATSTLVTDDSQTGRMHLFQELNLAHADALEDLLAIKPLDVPTIRRLMNSLGSIVEKYTLLFSGLADDCERIQGCYERLCSEIEIELTSKSGTMPSANVTRLVKMFEDPSRPEDIRTLHGLKRYLHQKGLKLGFKLTAPGRSTDRTVHLLLLDRENVIGEPVSIRYADLDPDPVKANEIAPYAVQMVVSGFARQMLYGQTHFPKTDIFCYGNEVQYYLSFGAHPAFLRINFSVPFQGGMIDLAYYGVSKNELGLHPSLQLDALRTFFERLEYDVEISNTHVHARYDKEHARTLTDVCRKAEFLFCLAPYLMDLDWIIGNLELSMSARSVVISHWGRLFLNLAALPLKHLLSADKRHHRVSAERPAAGLDAAFWNGESPFPDTFLDSVPERLFNDLSTTMDQLGIERRSWPGDRDGDSRSVIFLERTLLDAFKQALDAGEVVREGPHFLHGSTRRVHETEIFADIINDEKLLKASVALGETISGLETIFESVISGWVDDHEIHAVKIDLIGEAVYLFVLHDLQSKIPLAFLINRGTLVKSSDGRMSQPLLFESGLMWSGLRRACYPMPPAVSASASETTAQRMHRFLQSHGRRPFLTVGRNILHGNIASRGRASGCAKFHRPEAKPSDFAGRILVSPAVRPEDIPILSKVAGVLTTGGGILSHAGLMANQFRIPAMVINGRWDFSDHLHPVVRYGTMDYHERQICYKDHLLTQRTDFRPRENLLKEGDLIALDAETGSIQVLGQDAELLAFRHGLLNLGWSARALNQAGDAREVLEQRGRFIRSSQGIRKALSRLTDHEQARYAAYELLLGRDLAGVSGSVAIRSELLADLLSNVAVGQEAENEARELLHQLRQDSDGQCRRALNEIPLSSDFCEILTLRHRALRARHLFEELSLCLKNAEDSDQHDQRAAIDDLFIQQAGMIFRQTFVDVSRCGDRHALRLLKEMESFGVSGDARASLRSMESELKIRDETRRKSVKSKHIIRREHGGIEMHSEIGWKAANLAEISGIMGPNAVPEWFAVSNHCFNKVLSSPAGTDGKQSLMEAIESVLRQPDLDTPQQTLAIRDLWDHVAFPQEIISDLLAAYRALTADRVGSMVAIRSSSFDEDSQRTSGAGQFDTFLFINGFDDLVRFIRRTWSGLWNERALFQRSLHRESSSIPGGGVIVQKMIHARVSGVLQTINLASGEAGEVVVNAGLGVGEGIVSGTVAADQIVVQKHYKAVDSLTFHYATAEKREYVTYNTDAGSGTVRKPAPYHQRFRPALEYIEIVQLVEMALRVEKAFRHPVDLEFAFEGDRLWLLQVRPVTKYFDDVRESLRDFPVQTIPKPSNLQVIP